MMELLKIPARELRIYDEIGEGQIVCEMRWCDDDREIVVRTLPLRIVWRFHPEIGRFRDFDRHDGGEWHSFDRDACLRVVRGRMGWPLERWRPFGCESPPGVVFPIIDPPEC